MRAVALMSGMLALLAAPGAAIGASVSVSPGVTAPGQSVHVAGSGFRASTGGSDACARATIAIAGPQAATLGHAATGADGSFAVDLPVSAAQPPGRYSLTASTPANGVSSSGTCDRVTATTDAATPFKLTPRPASPDPPPPGPPPPPPGPFLPIGPTLSTLLPPQIRADCAAVLNPATDKLLALKNPDAKCYTGSTAKTMTLHVALEALKNGQIHAGDKVTFGQQALAQGCTCLGSYAADKDPAKDGGPDNTVFEPEYYALPGETMQSLNDMLMGVVMSAAEPTVMTAEHTAEGVLGLPPATTQAEDNNHELQFIGLMNQHTAHAGAPNTTFYTEHGGDLPVDSSIPLQANGLGPAQSTARDMTHLWKHFAASDPLFVQLMGFRGTYTLSTVAPGNVVRSFKFAKGYAYYPHVDADKNGGSTGCITCVVGQATRFGRTLIFDVMQSPDDKFGQPKGYVEQDFTDGAIADAGRALDYAFGRLLSPVARGSSAKHGGHAHHAALDCRGATRCVTAAINNGSLVLRSWAIDTPAKHVKLLGTGPLSSPNVAIARAGGGGGTTSRPAPKHGPPVVSADVSYQGPLAAPGGNASHPRVRAAKAGPTNDIAVVLERVGNANARGGSHVELRSFRIGAGGSPIKQLHSEQLPSHSYGYDGKITRLSPERFAIVLRRPDKHLRIEVWKVNGGGVLKLLDGETTLDMLKPGLSLGAADGWIEVGHRSAPDGHVRGLFKGVTGAGKLSGLLYTAVDPVGTSPAVATSRASGGTSIFTLSEVTGADATPGAPPPGAQTLNAYVASTMSFPNALNGFGDMGPFEDQASEVAIAPLGDGTVSAVVHAGSVRLYPAEADPSYFGNYAVTAYERTGSAAAGPGKGVDMASLGHKHGVGEFVLSKITPKGLLEVSAWRVG